MAKKTKGALLAEDVLYTKKSVYEIVDDAEKTAIMTYCEDYKKFLDDAKTEREAVECAVKMVEKAGYKPYKFGEKLAAGDKRYYNNRGKSFFAFRIGSENLEENGVRIMAAHIDSPRLDLKQVPLYEDSEMGFLKTHYYGGIKKYQWTAIPLALHGVVVLADGKTVTISVGEKPGDPVFYINDILPHLGGEQAAKPLGSAIPGENLNILVGGMPYPDPDVENRIKLNVLDILYRDYGIREKDFMTAEICAVPAYDARDIGFDRALIGAYGHDDRVCAYPALTALLDEKNKTHTAFAVLADKEEIGSEGNSGMQCRLLLDLLDSVADAMGANRNLVRAHSKCLSADVNAAFDPNFPEVFEKRNSAILSCGTTLSKYTGARGKSGTSDASAEFVGYVCRLFDEAGVIWQTSELGKVDAGGGGTVAKFIANLNIDVVDLGVPVISMHAPYEVVSKADVYMTYKAFRAFCR